VKQTRKIAKEWTKGSSVCQERRESNATEVNESNALRIKEKKHRVKERNGWIEEQHGKEVIMWTNLIH
jgi:hypothetical protein